MSQRGIKISLEGIDGVGKTTQKTILEDHLKAHDYEVFVKPCRNEMESDDVDGDILDILKSSRQQLKTSPESEVLLQAARMLYVNERLDIKKKIGVGCIVLCDRDIDTAIAYSLPDLSRKHDTLDDRKLIQWILGVYALEHTLPDLTLLLDSSSDIALGRAMSDEIPNERAIFDVDGVAFIEEVQKHYSTLHEMFPDRVKYIDVSAKGIEQVSHELIDIVDRFLEDSRSLQ